MSTPTTPLSLPGPLDGAVEDLGAGYVVPRVDLLPPEIAQARRLRRTQRLLAGGLVGVVAACAGGYLLAVRSADDAAADLAVAQARTAELQAEQAQYAEVPLVLSQVEAAESARELAMGTDVLWYRYLNDIALTYPTDVWLENITASVAGPGGLAGTAPVPVAGDNPLAAPGVGTITFTGKARQHSDVATWLDVLDGTGGFSDAAFSDSSRTEVADTDLVQFTSQVVLTESALSHRYDRKAQ